MRQIQPLTPSWQLPLHGKRILITSPRNYAARLAQQIINYGGLPILMPTIETCRLSNYTALNTAIGKIEEFDWLIFTSRNGMEAFCQRLEALGLSSQLLHRCQVCALGQDGEKLRELGVKVDLIPSEASPQGIIEQLSTLPKIRGQKVLVPVPEVVGVPEPNIVPQFTAGLQKLGLQVTRVSAYQTRCLPSKLYEVELDLLSSGKIEVIAFSSTAEISAFLQMVGGRDGYGSAVIACFGPYTAANAQKLGFRVKIVSQDFSSFQGFAEAIGSFFASRD